MSNLFEKTTLIGHGYWGKKIYQTLQKISKEEISVFDKFSSSNSELEVHSIDEFSDFLQNTAETKNYFFIATPEQTHFSLVKQLLQTGQYVFVEKPLSLTKVEAKELIQLAEKNSCNVFVDRIFLYDQGYHLVKNIIKENSIGQIKRINSIRHSQNIKKAEISVFDDLAPHDIYLVHDLLKKYPTEQSIQILQKVENQVTEAKLNWKIEEVEWQNWYSWNAYPTQRTMTIHGEKGKIIWQKGFDYDEVIIQSKYGEEKKVIEKKTPALELVIQDFLQTCKQENTQHRKLRSQEYIHEIDVLESIRVQSSTL